MLIIQKLIQSKIKLLVLFLFLFSVLFYSKQSYADTACSPYDCSGNGAYLYVGGCLPSSGTYNCYNDSSTIQSSRPYSCPTGGPSGSCVATVQGAETCGGHEYQGTSYSCSCSGYLPGNSTCQTGGDTSGTSCSAYGNTCSCTATPNGICSGDRSKVLGCCNITTPPTTTPSLWCGDAACSGSIGENCSNCETDCGSCSGGSCGDGSCNNGETNCTCATDCSGTCPGTPSCSVSLSPSNVTMGVTDSPYNLTANVSNLQNGNVSEVEFSLSNSNVTLNPVFDNSNPYQTSIEPSAVGSSVLTTHVRMGGSTIRCSASANVTINTVESTAPDCEYFTVTPTSVSTGENVRYTVEFSDIGTNLAPNGGFETGNVSSWTTAYQISSWWAPAGNLYPYAPDGAYFSAVSPQLTATDPHVATGWIEAGEDLSNKEYTLELKATAHAYNEDINRIYLQREPKNGDWSYGQDLSNKTLSVTPGSTWTEWSNAVTWPYRGYTNDTSRFRIILRPGSTHGGAWSQPIYYDSVKAYKTNQAGINPDPNTIEFYYATVADYAASPVSWTKAIGTLTNTTGSTYTFDWNTTGIPQGDYYMRVSMFDLQGNKSTGNQYAVSPTKYRPTCGANISVTPCTPSCAPAGACGTLNNTPGAVSNVTVSGISGNNLNLTTYPLPRTISWTAANITSPSTVTDHDVWLVPRGAGIPASEAACTSSSTCRVLNGTAATSVSLPTVLPAQTNEFDILVKAKNGCTDVGTWVRREVNLTGNVSGTIYDSQVTESGGLNNCSGDGGGSAINIDTPLGSPEISHNYGSTTTVPSSTYTLSDVPYNPNGSWYSNLEVALDLNNYTDPANRFYCNCPQAGNPFLCNQTDTTSPATGENFFVSAIDLSNGPWWQASQGNVYGSSGYTNPVPDACALPTCNANTIVRNSDDEEQSAGAPMSGGTVSVSGYYTDYNDAADQPHADSTSHDNLVREDYEFFAKEVDLGNVQTISGTQTSIPSGGTTYDDAEVFYAASSTNFELSNETITGNNKIIIFVNGDITIENTGSVGDHILTVEEGSYIAFIANGTITFENNIGNVMTYPAGGSTTTNIDGVFIADNIVIADDNDDSIKDNLFVGEGTFVGWDGVSLNRSYDNSADALDRAINNDYPTALFNFRPDFNLNTPEIMKRPNLVWQEVN